MSILDAFASGELERLEWIFAGVAVVVGGLYGFVAVGRRRHWRRIARALAELAPKVAGRVLEPTMPPRLRFCVDGFHGTLSFPWSLRPRLFFFLPGSRDRVPRTCVEIRLPRAVDFRFAEGEDVARAPRHLREPLAFARSLDRTGVARADIVVRAGSGLLLVEKLTWLERPDLLEALLGACVRLARGLGETGL
ncbi:MAG TPA: hypothetical protein VF316_06570 [Polyangiaceae bacterium]